MGQGRKTGPRDACARTYDDDGIDFRRERRAHDRSKHEKRERKDEQLAKVAMRAAERVLAESPAPIPEELRVLESEVRGAGSHVLIRVGATRLADWATLDAWLAARAGAIRAELAHLLNRKRTPSVTLRASALVPSDHIKGTNDEQA